MFKIYPYKLFSESATALSKALKVKRIKPQGSYEPKASCVVLNWGNSQLPWSHCKVINKPSAVAIAANKLKTFETLRAAGISIPEYSTSRVIAETWLRTGARVFARHKLNGHNGEGIEIVEPGMRLPAAPLYVKYQRKDREYRVHVFNGKVIDVTEKRKRSGERGDNGSLIRNLANGYVYCRDGVVPSASIVDNSIRAVRALGLDFGAVDIIQRGEQVWVLEVNSAPGVTGTTLEKYRSVITSTYGEALRPKLKTRKTRVKNQSRRPRYF